MLALKALKTVRNYKCRNVPQAWLEGLISPWLTGHWPGLDGHVDFCDSRQGGSDLLLGLRDIYRLYGLLVILGDLQGDLILLKYYFLLKYFNCFPLHFFAYNISVIKFIYSYGINMRNQIQKRKLAFLVPLSALHLVMQA